MYVRDGCVNMDVASYWEGGELVCMSEIRWVCTSDKLKNICYNFSISCVLLLFQCQHIPEVVTLLDIADKNIPENFNVEEIQDQLTYPFVVVEGLDATGNNR